MAGSGEPGNGDERAFDADPSYDVIVPDDIRELELEVQAWRREQAAAGRRARVDRLLRTRHWQRSRLAGSLVAGVLLVVALFGGLLSLVVPGSGRDRAPRRAPESAPPALTGKLGGLLPNLRLRLNGVDKAARSLPPAVLALLPIPCRCSRLVDELSGQAAEFGLTLVLVAPASTDPELPGLVSAGQRHGPVQAAYDAQGVLARDYAARGPTLVLVRDDGQVTGVERNAAPGQHREQMLRPLVGAG